MKKYIYYNKKQTSCTLKLRGKNEKQTDSQKNNPNVIKEQCVSANKRNKQDIVPNNIESTNDIVPNNIESTNEVVITLTESNNSSINIQELTINNHGSQSIHSDNTPIINTQNDDDSDRNTHELEELAGKLSNLYEKVKLTPLNERERFKKPPRRMQKSLEISIDKINKILEDMILQCRVINVQNLDDIIYASTILAIQLAGLQKHCIVKKKNKNYDKKKNWKTRMKVKIDIIRSEISQIEQIKTKNPSAKIRKNTAKLRRKYNINDENKRVLELEKHKQRLAATSTRLKRFEEREKQYRQNYDFTNDPKKIYSELRGTNVEIKENEMPSKEEIQSFWKPLYENKKCYNKNAQWIEDYEKSLHVNKNIFSDILVSEVKSKIQKFGFWKSPGIDNLQNYWWHKFHASHNQLTKIYNEMLKNPDDIPTWMFKGITRLIPKKTDTRNPANYRPITCLPIIYKILSGILTSRMMEHLQTNNLIPEEQKGGIADCYGCIDQLIINSMVLDDAKQRNKNLSIAWIDYKKAFDSIPHDWLIKSLEIHGFDDIVINFFKKGMEKWKTNLHISTGNKEITSDEIKINSGILQGDCPSGLHFVLCLLPLTFLLNRSRLGYYIGKSKVPNTLISHLIFMDDLKLYASNDNQLTTLINITKLFSDDIRMEFGFEKCNKVTIKKGKLMTTGDIKLNEDKIKELDNSKTYVYLGISERDKIFKKNLKEELKNEYFKRLKKIISSKLNSINMISAVNTFAIPAITYGFQILDWSITELEQIDRDTRKMLKKNKLLNINSNNHRIYLPRKQGGRGLLNITDQYKKAIINMSIYLSETKERLLLLVRKWTKDRKNKSILKKATIYCDEENINYEELRTADKITRKLKLKTSFHRTHYTKYADMPLHGQYLRELNQPYIDQYVSTNWIREGKLKPTTEATIFAIQEQAVTTNYIKKKIHKNSHTDKCRLCQSNVETIHHIISGCTVFAKTEYIKRHNNVAKEIYIRIAEELKLLKKNENQWYKFEPTAVIQNNDYKILWDFPIQTDKEIIHNRPDIIVINKLNKTAQIIDIAIPSDYNVVRKRNEKITKYIDLSIELKRMWKLEKISIIPVIIGATGTVYRSIKSEIDLIPGYIKIETIQRIAILGTSYIWRRFNELIRH